jgi:hypothetical protein
MKRIPRVLITGAGAAIMAIVTAAGASAAGFLGPGHFSTDAADANASWYSTSPYVTVSVDRGTFVFRPSHHGGLPFIQHATTLYVSVQTDTSFGQDCFVVPDSAFVESNGVQSASLRVTVDATNLCPGFATPVSGVIGDAGGGPPPPPPLDLPFPVTVTMTWTGNGVTSSNIDTNRSSCGGLSSVNHSSMASAIATASGTISLGDGTVLSLSNPDYAQTDAGSFVSDIQGTPNPLCYGV